MVSPNPQEPWEPRNASVEKWRVLSEMSERRVTARVTAVRRPRPQSGGCTTAGQCATPAFRPKAFRSTSCARCSRTPCGTRARSVAADAERYSSRPRVRRHPMLHDSAHRRTRNRLRSRSGNATLAPKHGRLRSGLSGRRTGHPEAVERGGRRSSRNRPVEERRERTVAGFCARLKKKSRAALRQFSH